MRATARNHNAGRPPIISASRSSRQEAPVVMEAKRVEVTGRAWMDREWSSQPLASDQSGWDWFSLHLNSGEKLMLFRLRQTDANNYCSGNWISRDGETRQITSADISMMPKAMTAIEGRKLPVTWNIAVPSLARSD